MLCTALVAASIAAAAPAQTQPRAKSKLAKTGAPTAKTAAATAKTSAAIGKKPAGKFSGKGQLLTLRAWPDVDATVIEVSADRPLSFTTMRLISPPRVVLDFADAELKAAMPVQEIEDGTVRRIGAAKAGTRTARVVIELASETDFEVRGTGKRLDVRVRHATKTEAPPAPLIASSSLDSPATAAATPSAAAVAPSAALASSASPTVFSAAPAADPAPSAAAPTALARSSASLAASSTLPAVAEGWAAPGATKAEAESPEAAQGELSKLPKLSNSQIGPIASGESTEGKAATPASDGAAASTAVAPNAWSAVTSPPASVSRSPLAGSPEAAREDAEAKAAEREREERAEEVRKTLAREREAADEKARVEAKAQAEETARLSQARTVADARAAEEERTARIAEESKAAERAKAEAQLAEKSRLEKEARAREQSQLDEQAKAAEKARLDEQAKAAEQARFDERVKAEQAQLDEDARASEKQQLEEQAKAKAALSPEAAGSSVEAEQRAGLPTIALAGSPHRAGHATQSAPTASSTSSSQSASPQSYPAQPASSPGSTNASRPAANAARSLAAAPRAEARSSSLAEAEFDGSLTQQAPVPEPRDLARSPRAIAAPGAHAEDSWASIIGIGYHPANGGTVVVRSDRALEVSLSPDPRGVRLHIAGAAIPLPNNRLPLDTSFFDGEVQRVVPLAAEGGVDLLIELRTPAQTRLQQDGGLLKATFVVPSGK